MQCQVCYSRGVNPQCNSRGGAGVRGGYACEHHLAVGVLARALAVLEVVQPLPHVLLHTHNTTTVTATVTVTAVTVTVAAVVEKAT